MAQKVTNEILIHAPAHKVWEVLTLSEYTREYMFGCSVETDWHPGSTLDWKMMHEGKELIPVTGTIKEIMPNVKLVYTVFDPNAGWADIPENYLNVTYSLMQREDDTVLTVVQDGFEGAEDGEKRYKDVYNNGEGWQPILDQIKMIAEKKIRTKHQKPYSFFTKFKNSQMKTLLIVRHAKTLQPDIGQADYDRKLNERGERDAPAMAKRMKERDLKIGTLVSSPAKRAKQTCKAFAKEFGINKEEIIYTEEIYNAPASVYFEVISKLKSKVETVAIFGHNPGITDFADSLCEDVHIDNMQTGSVFAVKIKIKDWSEFGSATKKFLFYDYPVKD